MTKKFILFLPLTAALITACGGTSAPTPAATLSTLTLSGVSAPLQISGNAKLTVTATGSDGQPFAGTPIFTSSDSNVVSVAADGTLNVRHLSVAPVVLTVSEGGKNATLNVTTYGLDAAGGTFSDATTTASGKLGSQFSVVFRNADGSTLTADTQVTIQGPSSFNAGAAVNITTFATTTLSDYDSYWNNSVPSVSGSYTATATVAGVVYRKTFTVDSTSALPRPTGVNLSNTATGFTVSGALPSGAANLNVVIYNDTTTLRFSSDLTSLPYNGTWNTPIPKGTYYTGTYATSFTGTSGATFPDQINRSFAYFADLVVP